MAGSFGKIVFLRGACGHWASSNATC